MRTHDHSTSDAASVGLVGVPLSRNDGKRLDHALERLGADDVDDGGRRPWGLQVVDLGAQARDLVFVFLDGHHCAAS